MWPPAPQTFSEIYSLKLQKFLWGERETKLIDVEIIMALRTASMESTVSEQIMKNNFVVTMELIRK